LYPRASVRRLARVRPGGETEDERREEEQGEGGASHRGGR
jgi:hypothetical protein